MYILPRKRTKLIDLTHKESLKKDNSRKILVNIISGNIAKNVDVSIHFTGLSKKEDRSKNTSICLRQRLTREGTVELAYH